MKFNPPIALNDGKIEIVNIDESIREITGIIHFDSTVTIGDHDSMNSFTINQLHCAGYYLSQEGFILNNANDRGWHFSLTSIIKNNNI